MRVLVTGGTGTLGRHFVSAAAEAGHTVRIMSRRARPPDTPAAIEWAQADLKTGAGLEAAVAEAEVILHAATRPGFRRVDVEGTGRLLEAARRTGVAHFVYPSIVGIDRVPFRYYRHKQQAEALVQRSGVPHTILRATQFHSLLDRVLSAAARVPLFLPLPTDFQFQSIAGREVAARLCTLLDEEPAGRLFEMGGPEVLSLGEMAHAWLHYRGKRRRPVRLPLPGRVAQAFRQGRNTAPAHADGTITWQAWLQSAA